MAQQATPEANPVAVAKRIGREYVESETLPHEGNVACAFIYGRIANTCMSLFRQIPVEVIFQKEDPYDDYHDMKRTVESEGVLRIYNQHTEHPFFSPGEQLAFRAVHDWFGHLEADVDFTPTGEYKKWDYMRQYFSPDENTVMFAEVVGQVGAVHYLKDGFADPRYEQRAFIAPRRWMDWMDSAVEE